MERPATYTDDQTRPALDLGDRRPSAPNSLSLMAPDTDVPGTPRDWTREYAMTTATSTSTPFSMSVELPMAAPSVHGTSVGSDDTPTFPPSPLPSSFSLPSASQDTPNSSLGSVTPEYASKEGSSGLPSHNSGSSVQNANDSEDGEYAFQSRIANQFWNAGAPLQRSAVTSGLNILPLSRQPLSSGYARDALLIYAHRLYHAPNNTVTTGITAASGGGSVSSEHVYRTQLLPLLQTLKSLHPTHLPILLLLGCVYHALGNYQASLAENFGILTLDPTYVEAMCNIGTTYKALGQTPDAEAWWKRAIIQKPTYWDALDNLIGSLVTSASEEQAANISRANLPKYTEALSVCLAVRAEIFTEAGAFKRSIPPHEMYRLQNLYYISGGLHFYIEGKANPSTMRDYVRAIEIGISPHGMTAANRPPTIKDLIIATCLVGLKLSSSLPETVEQLLGHCCVSLSPDYAVDYLGIVVNGFEQILSREGSGALPTVLLDPDLAVQLPSLLFPLCSGTLPSVCTAHQTNDACMPPPDSVKRNAHTITATTLLALAKTLQDSRTSQETSLPEFGDGIAIGPSLILLFYYLAFAFSPSPSACNNMGILLASVPSMRVIQNSNSTPAILNNLTIAQAYYERGLEMDPDHPHLLTNMGSLLREMGQTEAAISYYSRAVTVKSDFDVPLANLANVLKDSGRVAESIPFYRHALDSNPNIPEAICGLATALSAVCDWRGRGGTLDQWTIDDEGLLHFQIADTQKYNGWLPRMLEVTKQQLSSECLRERGSFRMTAPLFEWLAAISRCLGEHLDDQQRSEWEAYLGRVYSHSSEDCRHSESAMIIRLIQWMHRVLQWRWYLEAYGTTAMEDNSNHTAAIYSDISDVARLKYRRPRLPPSIPHPQAPSVLPFHTFSFPMSCKEIRTISHRTAIRAAYQLLTQHWLPEHIYPPPSPPQPRLRLGYLSSDLNNHPLAHLMQSVFGLHNRSQFSVYVYASTKSDSSQFRQKIETEAEFFRDVSGWDTREIIDQIIQDGIHTLINLNGYTKDARNEVFAARVAPVQIALMGFAGTLAAGWCDYLIADTTSCPPHTCGKERAYQSKIKAGQQHRDFQYDFQADPQLDAEDWIYTEKHIYMPHSFMVTDHKQSCKLDLASGYNIQSRSANVALGEWRQEQDRCISMKRQVFPDLTDEVIIFANFNQLYKIDPTVFMTWLRILHQVPNSVLWLLRFPAAGEQNLRRTAEQWANPEVASRIRFTDVAEKSEYMRRAPIADIFLDTFECNAHTVAADVLWSGVPIVTWPRYEFKMCSRVSASMANATGFGTQMVVHGFTEYERRAITLARSITCVIDEGTGSMMREEKGELMELRRQLYLKRDTMPLFDTKRWTSNLEKGFRAAWQRWVYGGDPPDQDDGEAQHRDGCIWVVDDSPFYSNE